MTKFLNSCLSTGLLESKRSGSKYEDHGRRRSQVLEGRKREFSRVKQTHERSREAPRGGVFSFEDYAPVTSGGHEHKIVVENN